MGANSPVYDRHGIAVYQGDCLDVMRGMPDSCVSAVVCDPPYGLSDHKPKVVTATIAAWIGGDRESTPRLSGFMGRAWDAFVPPPAVWDECLRVLKPGGFLLCFAGTRTVDLMGLSIRLAGFEIRDSITWHHGTGWPKGKAQLKPASEPILVARKKGPLWLNIDACRVGLPEDKRAAGTKTYQRFDPGSESKWVQPAPHDGLGRWPANVAFSHAYDCGSDEPCDLHGIRRCTICLPEFGCVDGCPVAELDAQSGILKSGDLKPYVSASGKSGGIMGETVERDHDKTRPGDSGGASRYFPTFRYQAKAPKRERPTVEVDGKQVGWPTVKPLALMRWLVRLVTPADGGVVLDPFAGSGTTGEAAALEGFKAVLIERDELALRLISERLNRIGTSVTSGSKKPAPAETLDLLALLDEGAA